MISVSPNTKLREFQKAIFKIYSVTDDRLYSVWDLLSNQERFSMRALKGVRQRDVKKIKRNLVISVAWLLAIMNRFHLDLERAIRDRFPYLCSYCGTCPCSCGKIKPKERTTKKSKKINTVKTLRDFQKMFNDIYPPFTRILDHAGVHMAEEQGEISEAIHGFLGQHKNGQLDNIAREGADFFSCVMGVANSLKIDFAKECSIMFKNNCHDCHQAPCVCTFSKVVKYQS